MNKNVKRISIAGTIFPYFLLLTFLLFLMFLFENFPYLKNSPAKVLKIYLQADTKYSVGYSENKFESIKIGMTEKKVIDIIGEPLTRWRPYRNTKFQDKVDWIGLQYSESPSSGNYDLRQIYLDSGKVVQTISYFYID